MASHSPLPSSDSSRPAEGLPAPNEPTQPSVAGERHRQQLDRFFQQAPAAMCMLDGPALVYELVNPRYQALFPGRPLVGLPLLEALPELRGHAVWETLQRVYRTGESHVDEAVPIPLAHEVGAPPVDIYFTYLFQARYDANNCPDGVLVCAFDVTDRVQAQQRVEALQAEVLAGAQCLAREREAFYDIFAATPAAVCLQHGPAHRYTYVNPAYQALFPDRELLGRTVAEALPETGPAGLRALLDGVYLTGQTYYGHEQPLSLVSPAGALAPERYFNFTCQAVHEHGQVVGVSTFAYDVTEQVRARQAQETQRRQLQDLFAQAPVGIATFRGPRYVIEMANPAVCAIWGRTQRQAVGTPLFELLPEVAGQGFEELLDGVLATGAPYVAHERPSFIDRDGRRDTVYWDFVYHPLREADGRVTGVTVVATEVSEQVRARQQLDLQRQLQRVFAQAPVAMGVFSGPDYLIDVCNPGLQAIWGRTAEQVLHRPLFEALPEVRAQFKPLLDEVRRTGVPFAANEVAAQILHQDQLTTVHLNFVYHPLRDALGTVTAIAAVAHDVTEQVAARHQVQQLNQQLTASNHKLYAANASLGEANEALGSANDQLTRTNIDLDTFVYTASHDLKAPISNIEGLLHMLLGELPPASQVGDVALALDLIQGAVDRFKHTIGHLSAIAHLQPEPAPGAAVPALQGVSLE